MRSALPANMRALAGLAEGALRCPGRAYGDVEIHRQLGWRIARAIVAGLVLQLASHPVGSRRSVAGGAHVRVQREVAGVDAQFFLGREGNRHLPPRGYTVLPTDTLVGGSSFSTVGTSRSDLGWLELMW